MHHFRTIVPGLFVIAFAGLFASSAGAQIQNRVRLVEASGNKPAVSAPRPARRAVQSVRRTETQVVVKTERVRVSSLSVITEPGAEVVAELKGPRPAKRTVTAGPNGTAIFDDLPPGVYKVRAEKDEFETAENERVTIAPQKAHALDLDLKQMTYRLKIQTNVKSGVVRYAPAIEIGVDASGSIISKQLGNFCVVNIEPNGQATIADLKKGYYDIDINGGLEYALLETGINIPEDIEQEETSAGLKTFEVALEKRVSTQEFGTAFAPADWDLASGWKLESGMKVRGDGIAIPRNVQYRNYINFQMVASVRLIQDGGTVGFALRALDDKNYYLLQLSGERGSTKNTATLRRVENGVIRPENLGTAPIGHFAKTMNASSGFKVTITGEGGRFTVWIEDSNTGASNAVGAFDDQYTTYPKGAIGLAGSPNANYDVTFFRVCPNVCK